jgi:hypothetical protein
MLTEDSEITARAVAGTLGIDEVSAAGIPMAVGVLCPFLGALLSLVVAARAMCSVSASAMPFDGAGRRCRPDSCQGARL